MRLIVVVILVACSAYGGDCWKELDVSTQVAIVFGDCGVPDAKTAKLTVGRESKEFPIRSISEPLHLIVLDTDRALPERLRRHGTVLISIGDLEERAPVNVRGFHDSTSYSIAIGPVAQEEKNAMRFRGNYLREISRGDVRGPAVRGELNLDTTDHGEDFIDDNFISISGGYSGLRSGDVLRRGFAGARVRYASAFHSGNGDLDAMLTFSGHVPLVQAFTFGGGPFAAPPLGVELNYGYRDATHGRVFEGTLTHNVFLGGRYWLAASGTFTVDDRTRRLYRVAISQFDDKESRVTLVTTFEDGSARVVVKKVRQYFIGLGWSFGLGSN